MTERKRGRPRKKIVGYRAAHNRIAADRGPARDYPCACGCGEQAQQWALLEDAPLRLLGLSFAKNRNFLVAYSLDPYDYQPMTRRCHQRYDSDRTIL